jgi:hypothetical protein
MGNITIKTSEPEVEDSLLRTYWYAVVVGREWGEERKKKGIRKRNRFLTLNIFIVKNMVKGYSYLLCKDQIYYHFLYHVITLLISYETLLQRYQVHPKISGQSAEDHLQF